MRQGLFGPKGHGGRGHGPRRRREDGGWRFTGWGRKRRAALSNGASGHGEQPNMFDLNLARLGATCRVVSVRGGQAIRQRLIDLGLHPGREITVLRNAPLNDPIEVKVGDSYIAVRRREAAEVEVEYV